jgi:hypothetical protein
LSKEEKEAFSELLEESYLTETPIELDASDDNNINGEDVIITSIPPPLNEWEGCIICGEDDCDHYIEYCMICGKTHDECECKFHAIDPMCNHNWV